MLEIPMAKTVIARILRNEWHFRHTIQIVLGAEIQVMILAGGWVMGRMVMTSNMKIIYIQII